MSNDHNNNESKMQAKVLIEDEKEWNALVGNHETRTSIGDEYIYESHGSYKEYPNSKYILTEDKITVNGVTCYRIKAIRNINTLFGVVAKGSLGGYVESERNLSKDEECWIFDNAKVTGDARVSNFAIVRNDAHICGQVSIWDAVHISDDAYICDSVRISGSARISGKPYIGGSVIINHSPSISGTPYIYDNARIFGSPIIRGSVLIYGFACIYGSAIISGSACVCGDSMVGGDTLILDDAYVNCDDRTIITGYVNSNAVIKRPEDIIHIAPFLSGKKSLTAFRNSSKEIRIVIKEIEAAPEEEFRGNLDEFIKFFKESKFSPELIEKYKTAVKFINIALVG